MLAGLPAGALALRFIERSHRTHLIFAPAAQSFCREVAMSGIVTMVALLLPGQAHAEEHFELAAGFFGGQRSLGQAPFAHVSGGSGAAGLLEPFSQVPYQSSAMIGPKLELRVVPQPLRLTLGAQRVFPTWSDHDSVTLSDGRIATATGLSVWDLRFGIGYEPPHRTVTPFVDLLGDAHLASSSVAIDGESVLYTSESFSLGSRAGLRVMLGEHTFIEAAGELGLVGPLGWSSHLMIGAGGF